MEASEKIQTLRAEMKRYKYTRDNYLSLYNSLRELEPARADFYLKLANKTTAVIAQKELCRKYSLSPKILDLYSKEGLPCFIISKNCKMNVKGARYRYSRAVFEAWLYARQNTESR